MKRQSPIDQHLAWKRERADVGCVFARYMAFRPQKFGQRFGIIAGRNPKLVAREIAERTTAYVDDPEARAAALLLPDAEPEDPD
jgi:hypothetical protein